MEERYIAAVVGVRNDHRKKKRATVWFIITIGEKEFWIEYNERMRRYYIGSEVRCVWPIVAELYGVVSANKHVRFVCSRPVNVETCAKRVRDVFQVEGMRDAEGFINRFIRPLWRLQRRTTVYGNCFLNVSPFGTCI